MTSSSSYLITKSFTQNSSEEKQSASKLNFPRQFDLTKYPNGLISKEKIIKIFDRLNDKSYGRYSKTEFTDIDVPFGIIKDEQGYYAIYNEEESDKTRKQIELGRGSSAAIKLLWYLGDGKNVSDGKTFAALKTGMLDSDFDFKKEHTITKKVAKAKGVVMERESKKTKKKKIEFVIDYHNGVDLRNLGAMIAQNQISEDILPQVILSLLENYKETMWDKQIIHCDIKLENCMFDPETGKASFVDFAFGKDCQKTGVIIAGVTQGTKQYMAPEIFAKQEYSFKTEMYALGLLLIELLYNLYLNENLEYEDLIAGCTHTSFAEDNEIKEFVDRMIADDPNQRPTFEEVFSFFNKKFGKQNQQSKQQGFSSNTTGSEVSEYKFITEDEDWLAFINRSDQTQLDKSNSGTETVPAQNCLELSVNSVREILGIRDSKERAEGEDISVFFRNQQDTQRKALESQAVVANNKPTRRHSSPF